MSPQLFVALALLAFALVQALLTPAAVVLGHRIARAADKALPGMGVGDAIDQLVKHGAIAVGSVFQTTVSALKDSTKPGTWDQRAASAAKAEALTQIRSMGREALDVLLKSGRSPEEIDKILGAIVESAVVDLKASTVTVSSETLSGGDSAEKGGPLS
jgi:hypothetical protein